MFNLEINKRLEELALIEIDRISEDRDARMVMKECLIETFNKYNKNKINTLATFPVKIASEKFEEHLELAYRISVLWVIFLEYIHIIDAIQDGDILHPCIMRVGEAQAINIAFLQAYGVQRLIKKLPVVEEYRKKLAQLFEDCAIMMFKGQYKDIQYTNYFDGELDVIKMMREKSGAAYKASIASLFTALGKDSSEYDEGAFHFGAFKAFLADYCDIWVHDYSDDLAAVKATKPIVAALKDPEWKELAFEFLAGKNTSPDKQVLLLRWLSRTRTAEALEEYMNSIKNTITTGGFASFEFLQKDVHGALEKAASVIETLKELREYCKEDTLPELNLKGVLEKGVGFLRTQVKKGLINDSVALHACSAFKAAGEDSADFLKEFSSKIPPEVWMTEDEHLSSKIESFSLLLELAADNKKNLEDFPVEKILNFFHEVLCRSDGKYPLWLLGSFYMGCYMWFGDKNTPMVREGGRLINAQYNRPFIKEYEKPSFYSIYQVNRIFNSLGISSDLLSVDIRKLPDIQKLDGSWDEDSRETAYVVLTLLDSFCEDDLLIRRAIRFIAESQQDIGGWQDKPFADIKAFQKSVTENSAVCVKAVLGYMKQTGLC